MILFIFWRRQFECLECQTCGIRVFIQAGFAYNLNQLFCDGAVQWTVIGKDQIPVSTKASTKILYKMYRTAFVNWLVERVVFKLKAHVHFFKPVKIFFFCSSASVSYKQPVKRIWTGLTSEHLNTLMKRLVTTFRISPAFFFFFFFFFLWRTWHDETLLKTSPSVPILDTLPFWAWCSVLCI